MLGEEVRERIQGHGQGQEQGQGKEREEEGDELISKKEVLARTGISYGQFYRWKRKGLIPESWFIRKSTFTGQEAFLPRAKILERIERIKELKDKYSLDEIAELLSPELTQKSYPRAEVEDFGWELDYYDQLRGRRGSYTFAELLHLAALERLRRALEPKELELAMRTLIAGREFPMREQEAELLLVRKPGASYCLICAGKCFLDPESEVVVRLELGRLMEELKIKLRERF